jgi:hypothetical protein
MRLMRASELAFDNVSRQKGTDELTYFSSKSGVLEFIAPNEQT